MAFDKPSNLFIKIKLKITFIVFLLNNSCCEQLQKIKIAVSIHIKQLNLFDLNSFM